MTYKIILASQSPRRRELLKQIGLEFQVMPCNAKEVITKKNPCEVVQELAYQKAMAIAREILGKRENEPVLVIGADTIVSINGEILGKPADDKDAYRMLSMLQGNVHQVYTGVALVTVSFDGKEPYIEKSNTFAEKTDVEFYPMSDEEIYEYIATSDTRDKAGAYGIQGMCARYIKTIKGEYNNVVGLPVGRLYQELSAMTK
ncbi:MAG: septum formation protein Maf [Lachnospiraceae bacterium]|nr:septum formation protein Maf [Lachnospiraceae bacterium]